MGLGFLGRFGVSPKWEKDCASLIRKNFWEGESGSNVAVVSAFALVALVVLMSARTVQANAGLPRPGTIATAAQTAATAASPTPATIADAELTVPGFQNEAFQFGHLDAQTESRLTWKDLKVGGDWPLTNTTERVWTAPRAVASAAVQTPGGEGEQFLFYRGVAHIDAPLRVSRDAVDELLFQSQLADLPGSQSLPVSSLWLVEIRPEGKIAFRELPSLSLPHSKKILLHTPAGFRPGDFNADNLNRLRSALQRALVAQGLYADEAQALLNTWEVSYFKSAGVRVFFLVPRAWTDFYLPLKLSQPADLQRVMVGRIELVTPKQRDGLRQISGFAPGQIQHDAFELSSNYIGRFFPSLANGAGSQDQMRLNREMAEVSAGRKPLVGVVPIPQTYQAYLDLGRFRNALVLNQARIHPAAGLINFIDSYRLQSYQVAIRLE